MASHCIVTDSCDAWARSRVTDLFLGVALAHVPDQEELAAVGGQVLADLDVQLLQLHLVVVVGRVP